MPNFDGTGPNGRGPMTGRGLGYCVMKQTDGKNDFEGYVGRGLRPFRGAFPPSPGFPIAGLNTYSARRRIRPLWPVRRTNYFGRRFYGRGRRMFMSWNPFIVNRFITKGGRYATR